ncbi:heme biosynthesis HemY N-terminal domain-containing protein [Hoeflea sp.]|uniref:heme biosynthesis protein HemY n=1 Tax=Hoeflea sp. TaxID=1940281 RepID=UPI003749B602
MIRLLFFVALVLVLGFGFSWLADRPGDLSIVWQDRRIEMSLMTAVTAMVSLVAAFMISWWLIRTIWLSPRLVSRYFRANKRDRGYQALSTGLLAAGAGDAMMARKMNKRSRGLLSADQEPLIHLLDVQTALIEGRNDDARKQFEALAEDPETRLLGLRGLYLEAQRQGATEAAHHYAEKAAELAPHLPWAGAAALSFRTQEGKWDEALRLLDQQRQAGTLEAAEADRKKAVLLTARARDRLDADPLRARDDALAALKITPGFAPAAVIATKALLRNDNLRKAARILETAWKANPHPEIADAYVRARVGDTAADRLKRAERLEKLKPLTAQAYDAVARAALEARRFDLARQKAEASARLLPCEGIYLLLADIEEAETGDEGRVRHWLSQALRAPRDPAWTADGYVSETWEPVSPVTGKLGAFEWKVPVEQLAGPRYDADVAEKSFDRAMASLPPVREVPEPAAPARPVVHPEPAAPVEGASAETVTVIAPEAPVGALADPVADALAPVARIDDVPHPMPTPIADADPVLETEAAADAAKADNKIAAIVDDKTGPSASEGTAAEPAKANGDDTIAAATAAKPDPQSEPEAKLDPEEEARAKEAAFLTHRPDDPGVDEDAEPEKPGRFRLF